MQEDKLTLVGATLHYGQISILRKILSSNAMYFTIVSPRQWGKSFFLVQLMLYYALNYKKSKLLFCSPTYSQASKIYKELMDGVRDSGIVKKYNSSENSIIFINGSELYFRSVAQPENMRGLSIHYMFLDEASIYREDTFNSILRPMLTVTGKKCFLFSTPRGKNFFYDLYMLGQNDSSIRYESYRCSSDDNPYANREEIADAKKTLPEALFRQEYLAEFVDDGGDVFQNTLVNSTITKWEEPNSSKVYYAGVDLGRQDDYTVLTILDNSGNTVFIYRKNKVDWTLIIAEVAQILQKYKPRYTLVECNGIGDVVFSMLKSKYSNITPWITSNQSKQDIIESLILCFQDNSIKIPTKVLFEPLYNELGDFSFNYSKKTRKILYAARNGHDDTVMSLAIANHAKRTGVTKGIYAVS